MADNSQTTNQDIPSSNATATLGHLGRPIPEARAYLNKAQRFVSFAKYLHGQLLAARRRFSDNRFERPTPEDMRDISATKTQFRQLCDGTLLDGANEALNDSFLEEVNKELAKLERMPALGSIETLALWKHTAKLVQEGKDVKVEFEEVVEDLRMKSRKALIGI